MTFNELKDKANSLPLAPGVYLMRDKSETVIYVGKAKKLKNRVSQYFQDTSSHTPKTRLMVSKIHEFDVIVAASEFEALVLECSLIKQHLPKYNILLKDDKGYPYIRLDCSKEYPTIEMVSRIVNDKADYFGPFGSRGVTQSVIDAIKTTLKLPNCSKQFPKELGKGRVCLHYHMDQCEGWCQNKLTVDEYNIRIGHAKQLLQGNFKSVADKIRSAMLQAADDLKFELAASLRNQLKAVEALQKKQLVTAGTLADTDVIGYAQTESKACFTVLHFSGGNLLDKDYEIFPIPDEPEQAVSSLMKQYYLTKGYSPKIVLLPFAIDDSALFEELLEQQYGRKPKLRLPQRGDNVRLVELANKNAMEEAERITSKEEKLNGTLNLLGKMLSIEPPTRIESFDVSNISNSDIVASMVVFQDGKPRRSAYKKFKIQNMSNQDDYASMEQAITRRFTHYKNHDAGFEVGPNLLLIDGGIQHVRVAFDALSKLDLAFPVFGMVKDDRHRTRALVTPDGNEIAIVGQQSVFTLIGTIQEETHRFAITYHQNLRNQRLRYSELDRISKIGPKRKQDLLKTFKSITAISSASLSDLMRILPQDAAQSVYNHFHNKDDQS